MVSRKYVTEDLTQVVRIKKGCTKEEKYELRSSGCIIVSWKVCVCVCVRWWWWCVGRRVRGEEEQTAGRKIPWQVVVWSFWGTKDGAER